MCGVPGASQPRGAMQLGGPKPASQLLEGLEGARVTRAQQMRRRLER